MPCQNSAVSSPRVPQLEMSVVEAVAVAEMFFLGHFHVQYFAVPRNLVVVAAEEASLLFRILECDCCRRSVVDFVRQCREADDSPKNFGTLLYSLTFAMGRNCEEKVKCVVREANIQPDDDG